MTIYLIAGIIVAIVVLWKLYMRHSMNRLFNQMSAAVDHIALSLYELLRIEYSVQLGEEEANLLAAAIVNEVLVRRLDKWSVPRQPGNNRVAEYSRTHETLIEQECCKLTLLPDFPKLITIAIRVEWTMGHMPVADWELNNLRKLMKAGLLLAPNEDPYSLMEVRTSPDTFLPMVGRFAEYVRSKTSEKTGVHGVPVGKIGLVAKIINKTNNTEYTISTVRRSGAIPYYDLSKQAEIELETCMESSVFESRLSLSSPLVVFEGQDKAWDDLNKFHSLISELAQNESPSCLLSEMECKSKLTKLGYDSVFLQLPQVMTQSIVNIVFLAPKKNV